MSTSLEQRISKEIRTNVRRDLFALKPEQAGLLLSKMYGRKTKQEQMEHFDWLLELLFNIEIDKTIDIGGRYKISITDYIYMMNEIAVNISHSERYTLFVRAVVFYPHRTIERHLGGIMLNERHDEVWIDVFLTRGILFNPKLSKEVMIDALSIVSDPMPTYSLVYFISKSMRNQVDLLNLVAAKDVTGKSLAMLYTLLSLNASGVWNIEYIEYVSYVLSKTYAYRKQNHEYSYQSIPINVYSLLFDEMVVEYIEYADRDIYTDNAIIGLCKVLFATNIKFSTSSAIKKKIVQMGLDSIIYFSPNGKLDREATLSFIGDCYNYLSMSFIVLKSLLRLAPDNDWVRDFNMRSLVD